MPILQVRLLILVAAIALAGTATAQDSIEAMDIERGKYLIVVGGCNDCHTPGYLLEDGNSPLEDWLLGDSLGWRGPWGTTYPTNLRLFFSTMTEDQWVNYAKTFRTRPPMAWFTIERMTIEDLRAMYRFVTSLEPLGEPAPAYVPPEQEPATPYILFPPFDASRIAIPYATEPDD